jgi:multiple sugar transport system permease protein
MFFEKYSDKKDGAIRGFDMRSRKTKSFALLIMFICSVIAIICIFPVLWVFLACFKDIKEFTRNATILPEHFAWERLAATWNAFKFTKYYTNSLILVAGGSLCAIFFNGLLAYGLGILKPKGHRIIFGLVMWSLLIPATTSIVALFRNINLVGLKGSFLPLWLVFGANAFYVVLFKQFFEEVPQEILEAARLDGGGVWTTFWRIVIPLSKPIIMVVAIFAVTAAWSDFLLPYLVLNGSGRETVMVKLFTFKDTPTDAVSVLRASLFAIIPPAIIFAVFQKQIMDGAAAGAVKG